MRIAIFSDVHGNLSALEAVLADIEQHAPDMVVFGGDLCLMGPRPAETLRLVLGRRIPSVIGNTDGWIAGLAEPPERSAAAVEWTRGQLSADEIAQLARLPFGLRVSPTARAADDLLIVHANPFNVDDMLYPPESAQLDRYEKIRQSDVELAGMLNGVEAAVLAFGHLHVPNIRPLESMTLVNVSSVSIPGDGDLRAKYALLQWTDNGWTATHQRVEYDVAAEREALASLQPPGWEDAVAALDALGN